jgi:hypothetical protein
MYDPRKLGLVTGMAVVVGVTIGSGIFRVPSGIAADTGNLTSIALVWILGGLELARPPALCMPSSASVWRGAKAAPRFPPPLQAGGLKGEGVVVISFAPSPLARRSLGGKACYVLTDCRRSRSSPSAAACASRSCCSSCREWTSR